MKIYTKTGDKGETALVGGKRVAKNHIRIEACGTIDELIAHIGVVRDHSENRIIIRELVHIQDKLMISAAILASAGDEFSGKLPKLFDKDIVWLEKRIDRMEKQLPGLAGFILPGGHPAVSFCHLARTMCRRAERVTIGLYDSADLPDVLLKFLNRLSDFLFVLARFLSRQFQSEEIPWRARL
jgi:cob(I)alamin adenosyltransferase